MPDPIDPNGNYDYDPATNSWVPKPVPDVAYTGLPSDLPSKPSHKLRGLGLLAIAGVFVIALAALVGGGSSGGEPAAAAPPATSPSAEPDPTPSDEPVADPGPDPEVLQQYVDETTNIAATAQALSEAALNEDEDALLEACETLGSDAQDGLALPDTNVPGVDKQWDAAMNDYADAALNCGVSDYDRAATSINKATAHIVKATDAIAAYAG